MTSSVRFPTCSGLYENKITKKIFAISLTVFALLSFYFTLYCASLRKKQWDEEVHEYSFTIRLYKSELNKLYVILPKPSTRVGSKLFGVHADKFRKASNVLWTRNKKQFYLLDTTIWKRNSDIQVYYDQELFPLLKVYEHEATLVDDQGCLLASYQREGGNEISSIFTMLRTGEAELIPYASPKRPVELFSLKKGDYFFISERTDCLEVYKYHVHRRVQGRWQTWPIKKKIPSEDGMIYELLQGGEIFSSCSNSYFQDAEGKKHNLEKLDIRTFNFHPIGITTIHPYEIYKRSLLNGHAS